MRDEGCSANERPHIYNQKSMYYVLAWASSSGKPIWQLVAEIEDEGFIEEYLAVSEEDVDGGYVVTAPTCGSAGVLPSVLYYYFFDKGHSNRSILNAIATAGVIGNLVKDYALLADGMHLF